MIKDNYLTPLLSLLAIFFAQVSMALAEPLKVVIVAPIGDASSSTGEAYYPADYDTSLVRTHLEGMLQGAAGSAGSSVTLLNDAGSLAYVYHAAFIDTLGENMRGYEDRQHLENNDYDVAILINDFRSLRDNEAYCFERASLLSQRLLAKGMDVYILEPGESSTNSISTKEKVHRIANGCGIHMIPAGEALRQTSSSNVSSDTNEAYVMAATIFSSLTDLGSASGSSYSTLSASLETEFEQAVEDAIVDTESTNYTGSFGGQGSVQHRPIDVTDAFHNNTINYAWSGTSTETGINTSLVQLINHYYRKNGTTSIIAANEKLGTSQGLVTSLDTNPILNDIANKDKFLFVYSRASYDDLSTALSNQSNMMPTVYGRQSGNSSGSGGDPSNYSKSVSNMLLTYRLVDDFDTYNTSVNPSYMMYGRAYEQFPDIKHLYDDHHQNQEGCDMIAAGILAANVGIDFDADDMNRFHHYREGDPYYIGWNTTMQLAYLSEDRNDIPDSNLTVTTATLPAASAAST